MQNTALSMSFAAVACLSLDCFDVIADRISATLLCQMPAKAVRLWRVRVASRPAQSLPSCECPDGSGGYAGQLAVLVKPNGLPGACYMAAIRPFRHPIVYPGVTRGHRAGLAETRRPGGHRRPASGSPTRLPVQNADFGHPITRARIWCALEL